MFFLPYKTVLKGDILMDVFNEQIVKRKTNAKTIAIIISTIALLFLVPFSCCALAVLGIVIPYMIYVGLFIFIIGIYLAWYIITSQKVEYEYAVAGGTLDIAKIIAKRKRKAMIKVEVKNIDLFCKLDDKRLNGKRFAKRIIAAGNPTDVENTYCLVYNSTAYGKTLIVFTPNEKIKNAMKPTLKKDIVLEMFYNRGPRNENY